MYPNDEICTYTISQPHKNYIIVTVQHFNLTYDDTCNEDHLEIRDGYSKESPLIGKFCGTQLHINKTIVSTQNNMWLR